MIGQQEGAGLMRMEQEHDQLQFSRRWRPALMSFFLRRVRDHAEAEDLTQEVFIRLVGHAENDVQSPEAWVFRVAANLLHDRARRGRVRADYLMRLSSAEREDVEPIDPYRILAGRESVSQIAAGLEELPERTREIFMLYRLENLTQAAIAESYGISASAVKQHVMKAMAHLMARMRNGQ